VTDLKKLVMEMLQHGESFNLQGESAQIIKNLYDGEGEILKPSSPTSASVSFTARHEDHTIEDTEEFVEESLLLEDKEKEMIEKALERHGGKRKNAANELGISERTLYRKIKEYEIIG
jgi:transcriptional regulator with PAS, ATPase and Fis domain